MATTLSGQITLQVSLNYQSSDDFGSASKSISPTYTFPIADGTGLNQAQKVWADQRTTDNTGETLDFSTAGGLVDAFGTAFSLTKLKAVIVVAAAANTTTVVVSRPATNGAGFFDADADSTTLRPGGWFVFTAPDATAVTVTNTTDDAIKINAGTAANVTYDIILVGI